MLKLKSPPCRRTCIVVDLDAGIEPDVLEHIINDHFTAVKRGESLGHGYAVDTGRSTKDESDPHWRRGDVDSFGTRDAGLATWNVLGSDGEPFLRWRRPRSGENVLTLALSELQT